VPGVVSKETIVWAAEHRYPYISLNTPLEQTRRIWGLYDEAADRVGYTPSSEHRGYLLRVHVSDSEEKAEKNAREFLWMQGEFTGLAHPVWANPSGYFSPSNRRGFVDIATGRRPNRGADPYEKQIEDLQIIAGTPKTVIPKLRRIMEEARPGIFSLWGNDGKVNHEDSKTCIRLLGQEVMPALREIAKELDLKGPFENDTPISTATTPADQLHPNPMAGAAAG
jgi:alkanesulfonate monooxygenase SsuD/methylene tetrahydromethanopterin reductase-like flavin-dependent oxidoreductase (luciferase family)